MCDCVRKVVCDGAQRRANKGGLGGDNGGLCAMTERAGGKEGRKRKDIAGGQLSPNQKRTSLPSQGANLPGGGSKKESCLLPASPTKATILLLLRPPSFLLPPPTPRPILLPIPPLASLSSPFKGKRRGTNVAARRSPHTHTHPGLQNREDKGPKELTLRLNPASFSIFRAASPNEK